MSNKRPSEELVSAATSTATFRLRRPFRNPAAFNVMLTCGDVTVIPLAASAAMMSLGRNLPPMSLAASRIA